MPVDPILECLFVDEVKIGPFIGKDFNNVETFGPDVLTKAHIAAITQEVLRRTGDVTVSTHRVVLVDDLRVTGLLEDDTIGDRSVDPRDRITMPSRFDITNPEIKAVMQWTDETGPHHATLKVGPRKGANA